MTKRWQLTRIGIAAAMLGAPPVATANEIVRYTYDSLGRLTKVKQTGNVERCVDTVYEYDPASNRTRVAITGAESQQPSNRPCSNAPDGTDFNGDGIDDVLWRSAAGELSNWLGTASGGFTNNDANAFNVVSTDWKIVGTGDFNGDGRDDILWRNINSGDLSNWLGQASGGYVGNDAAAYTPVPTTYRVVGVGDFNGDGMSDILWRGPSGTITNWLGLPTGGFQVNDANSANPAPSDWNVAGTGDFNGDGRSDIVWRRTNGEMSNWLGQPNGGFVSNGAVAGASVETRWVIAGVGDFNGDGYSDLLWRSDAGELTNWLGRNDGGFNDNIANAYYSIGTDWQVVGTKNYNGDRQSDILWRSNTGVLSNWLGLPSGAFANNDANALTSAPTNWYVQGPSTF